MIRTRWVAVGLGSCYTVAAGIMLLVEPGMGFHTFADFWNPDLVVPALSTAGWLISDLCHLGSGTLLMIFAASLAAPGDALSRLVRNLGIAAGTAFVFVAMIDWAARSLPTLVPDPAELATLSVGYIATRVGVLFAGAFLLGSFVVAFALEHRHGLPRWFVVLSVIVGASAIVFFLVPSPMPVALAVWAFAVAWVGAESLTD